VSRATRHAAFRLSYMSQPLRRVAFRLSCVSQPLRDANVNATTALTSSHAANLVAAVATRFRLLRPRSGVEVVGTQPLRPASDVPATAASTSIAPRSRCGEDQTGAPKGDLGEPCCWAEVGCGWMNAASTAPAVATEAHHPPTSTRVTHYAGPQPVSFSESCGVDGLNAVAGYSQLAHSVSSPLQIQSPLRSHTRS
jgi:hypothetical protein